MSHTPGPWIFNADGGVLNIRPKGTGWLLATIEEHWLSSQHHDYEANARLIAAAPDMYDALKRLLAARHEWHPDRWYAAQNNAIAQAEAAIAKAEGKE